MKKGKITTTESACIKGMLNDGLAIMDMANQLDRSAQIIEKEVKRIKREVEENQLFIKQTASGNKGVSILTPTGSMRGDSPTSSEEPTSQSTTVIKNSSPWVHKIKNNG